MANIQESINQIKNAVYGKEVRGSIVSALEALNTELGTQIQLMQQLFSSSNIYIEKETNNYYVKFDFLKLKNKNINLTWQQIKTTLDFYVTNSPNRVESLKIDNNSMLVLKYSTKNVEIINFATYNPEQYFVVFSNIENISSSPLLILYSFEQIEKVKEKINHFNLLASTHVALKEATFKALEQQTNAKNYVYFKHGTLTAINDLINTDYTFDAILSTFQEGQTIIVSGIKYLKLNNNESYVFNIKYKTFYITSIPSSEHLDEVNLLTNNNGLIQSGVLMNVGLRLNV